MPDEAREQSRGEETLNVLLHGGAVLAAPAAFLIAVLPRWRTCSTKTLVVLSVFVASIVVLYGASALYHAWRSGPWKRRLQGLDHAAIFGLIAGTYTPVSLLILRGSWGWWLFALEWILAVSGVALQWSSRERFERWSLWWYLVMGWLLLPFLGPFLHAAPLSTLAFLAAGGLVYTLGAVFYVFDRRPYFHALWHTAVLAGTALQFWAIITRTVPA